MPRGEPTMSSAEELAGQNQEGETNPEREAAQRVATEMAAKLEEGLAIISKVLGSNFLESGEANQLRTAQARIRRALDVGRGLTIKEVQARYSVPKGTAEKEVLEVEEIRRKLNLID